MPAYIQKRDDINLFVSNNKVGRVLVLVIIVNGTSQGTSGRASGGVPITMQGTSVRGGILVLVLVQVAAWRHAACSAP